MELAQSVYTLTRDRFFSQPGDLRDQIRRAALSVSNNVAEGFERGSTAELIAFLYIARGSAGEVRSMLRFVENAPSASHLHPEITAIIAQAESCSRQIRAWADHLQNTSIKGQRHLTEQVRRDIQHQREVKDFYQYIDDIVNKSRNPQSPSTTSE